MDGRHNAIPHTFSDAFEMLWPSESVPTPPPLERKSEVPPIAGRGPGGTSFSPPRRRMNNRRASPLRWKRNPASTEEKKKELAGETVDHFCRPNISPRGRKGFPLLSAHGKIIISSSSSSSSRSPETPILCMP